MARAVTWADLEFRKGGLNCVLQSLATGEFVSKAEIMTFLWSRVESRFCLFSPLNENTSLPFQNPLLYQALHKVKLRKVKKANLYSALL